MPSPAAAPTRLDGLLLLSDAHLRGPADPGLAALCAMIAAHPAPGVALLGDLLHAGWTWRGPSPADDVLQAILDAVGSRPLLVCPGNHDFGLRWPKLPQLCVAERHLIEVGGRRAILVHGDEADRRRGYRLTRRVVRGRPFAALIDALGPIRGQRALDALAGAPGADPRRVDAGLVEAQRRWGRAQLGPVELVVMGHSHHLGLEAQPGGALLWLGSWVGQRSGAVLGPEGPAVFRYDSA
jgi:UDP-2,3-diacylglucosamine pyrophosphatase LpxH